MEQKELSGLGLWSSFWIFGLAGLVLYVETHFFIPWLSEITGIESILFWFLVAGLGMFLPLLMVAFFLLKQEGVWGEKNLISQRLRFHKMNRHSWLWAIGAVFVIGFCSAMIMNISTSIWGSTDHQPPFMAFEPLTPGRYWILLAWFPYWILNIMGEEILWRGVIFPRQEVVFGNSTWFYHGLGWMLFHIPFGWQLLLTMLPILFIQSYAVQKTKNSSVGVAIHALINGPSFIAISFGLL